MPRWLDCAEETKKAGAGGKELVDNVCSLVPVAVSIGSMAHHLFFFGMQVMNALNSDAKSIRDQVPQCHLPGD